MKGGKEGSEEVSQADISRNKASFSITLLNY
jgi:hypothetical protein